MESFDLFSKNLNSYNLSDSKFQVFHSILNQIFFHKVRFLIFLILFTAIILFYVSFKNTQNNIIFYNFLNGFNQNLKTALFFKKINFLNWLFILFFFILLSNVLSLIPETVAFNSIFFVTIFLSFWMSFVYNFYGLTIKKEAWFDLFLPQNIPFLITGFLCFIEIISYFIKIFSLAIRLFANILAGHILLHLLVSYLSIFLKSFNFYLLLFSIIFIVVIFSLTLLEWFMACMQAFIFVLLISMWLNENIC